MTSVLTATRCRNPLLTRVEDLENSPEWLKLTCSINDLSKLSSPQALKNNRVNHERSTSKLSAKNFPEPEVWAKEFEKSYFYQQEPELMSTKLISKTNSQIPLASDKNSKKTSKEFTGKDKTLASSNIHEKSDFLFRPGSMEFRGSRERLHEIFEHNRLLRKRFFELDGFNSAETSTGLINRDKDSTLSMQHSGFGSTETLGSQSNQSGGSSTNEKSRDFENSPDIDEIVKIDKAKMYDSSTPDINPYDSSAFANPDDPSGNDGRHLAIGGKSCRDDGQNGVPVTPFRENFGNFDENSRYNEKFYSPSDNCDGFDPYGSDGRHLEIGGKSCRDGGQSGGQVTLVRENFGNFDENVRYNENFYSPSDDCEAFVNGCRAFNSFQGQSNTAAKIPETVTKENFRNKQNTSKLQEFCRDSSGFSYDFVNDPLKREERGTCEIGDTLKSPQLVSSFSNSMMDLNGEFCRIERSHLYDTLVSDAERRKSIGSSTPGNGSTLPFVYGPIPYKSPRRYVEGEVTIHYRSPVRTEAKEILSEEELARKSAENMRRVYQEERRRKYLQELHDIDSRRHTDNFTPSQKSPIPLNRYDDFIDDLSYRSRSQEHTPEPRLVARALYNFVGQTTRELSFRRGDIILIRRQIDKNWYEGEHNAMIGLFPLNYVEILPYDGSRGTPKKSYEGQARAKFNFIAQTNLELSLAKGELVVLKRRVDENWFEGRIGNKKGIFPVTYVEVILEPGQHRPETPVSSKPVASPAAHSMLSNGTASGKLSMGPHHYTPSIPVKTSTAEPQYISLPRIGVTERNKLHVAPVNETLHIDTHSDTIPYRALYNYRPQNEDELELKEGDTVYVMEKCDDGWFVGSSQRTGYFGTFPGNYVERL